jgi:hypothetical protein
MSFYTPVDFFFPMAVDIYNAVETQDEFGKIQKNWVFDRTHEGYFETFGSNVAKNKGLDPLSVIELRDKLIGRTRNNPLVLSDGTYRVINSILITNIRDVRTQEPFFLEADTRTLQFFSTQYEIHFTHPYVNAWNDIEYHKVILNRIERQEIGGYP